MGTVMYLVINKFIFFLLFFVPALLSAETPYLARFVESNEITESDNKGGIRLVKTTADNCRKMMGGLIADLKKLAKHLSREELKRASPLQTKVLSFTEEQCQVSDQRQQMFQLASQMIREHGKKIAVLMPRDLLRANFSKSLREGLLKGSGLSDKEFSKRFVFVDIQGGAADRAVAMAYFIHNATLLIGGINTSEAERISYWSRRVLVPSLITHYQKKFIEQNKRAFLLFPNLDNIYSGIKKTFEVEGLKKVAVMYPNNAGSFERLERFALEMRKSGVKLTHKIAYDPGDYHSMEAAAKKVFSIDRSTRRAEYNRAYRRLRRKAREANTKFNPRLVSLSPVVSMDAIYIADNFRSVRFLVNIFEYLGVEKIRLIGDQQWRARSLIEPWDPLLEGAYFVDYVGSYASLPAGLASRKSDVFVSPIEAQRIDHKLIGYLGGYIGKQVLFGRESSRSQMHRFVSKLSISESHFFGRRSVFRNDRSTNWPYFKFKISGRAVQLAH